MHPKPPANGAWHCCTLERSCSSILAAGSCGAELLPSVPACRCRAAHGSEDGSGEEGVKAIPAAGAPGLARLLRMQEAAQEHPHPPPPRTRCPGNCTFKRRHWQRAPAGDAAVAIKSNCLHVVRINFELGGQGRGAGCTLWVEGGAATPLRSRGGQGFIVLRASLRVKLLLALGF